MTTVEVFSPRLGARRWLGLAVFIAITIAMMFAARAIDWRRALALLTSVRPGWIAAGITGNVGIVVCWSAFWLAVLPRSEARIPFKRMFEIVAATSSLMNTVPFGAGHASSVLLLIRRGGASQRGALSVLALDQLGEGITKLTIFLLAAAVVPLPAWMRTGIVSAALAIGTLFLVLMIASRWASELAILKSVGRSAAALACVVAMKGVQGLAIFAVQRAFDVDLPAAGTLLVLAAIVLGTMVPLAPGNLGTYEASAFLAYRFLGIAPEQALSLAIMQHVCFMLPAVGIGYLYLSAHTLSRSEIASS
jgi:uncharacterized membrane protein YbhN (UPF0104 family)